MSVPVFFDEMTAPDGEIRAVYEKIADWLQSSDPQVLETRRTQAEFMFRRIGITFSVYGSGGSNERLIPFDIIPRLIAQAEWRRLEAGLIQRVEALNAFVCDIYGQRECIRAGLVPEDLIFRNAQYRPEMAGQKLPHNVAVHIAGIDLVRTGGDQFYILEDNARTPSGVSYMLENREVTMRIMPDLFARHRVQPVENYTDALLSTLKSVAPPAARGEPVVVLLTPGQYNSAYYEHSFLADRMGIELVQGSDLFVDEDVVYMRTTYGPQRVDVIYRRVDDDFLDPLAFNPASALGVAGLMAAYLSGNVTLVNAVGTGIADDKAIYSYMPELVKFFTGEDAIIPNVPTWRCREADAYAYVREHIAELVIKEVNGSGGYGMLVGPHASAEEREIFAKKLEADPANYIAQPTLALSTCPAFAGSGIAPRHVDLRPFILTGAKGVRVIPGGLTRVAMKEGSLVVNSSQGGGTKDTWVVDDA